ncbi:MAG TPA: hypothetical protein PLK34_01485 [Candidatus Pacearchaeota archaeon]|nr:hypothetical protein [Candidatus Pacearchaeota archaeon]
MSFKKVVGWAEIVLGLIILIGVIYCFINPEGIANFLSEKKIFIFHNLENLELPKTNEVSQESERILDLMGFISQYGMLYLVLTGIAFIFISIAIILQGILNISERNNLPGRSIKTV